VGESKKSGSAKTNYLAAGAETMASRQEIKIYLQK
jgi:hypothetical protein